MRWASKQKFGREIPPTRGSECSIEKVGIEKATLNCTRLFPMQFDFELQIFILGQMPKSVIPDPFEPKIRYILKPSEKRAPRAVLCP